MRIELPTENSRANRQSLVKLVAHLMRSTGAGKRGAAVVITCDDRFARSGSVPWLTLANELKVLFRQHNWPLRDLAVVARDGWAALLDQHPHTRRPLAEISASPITEQALRFAPPPRDFQHFTELPEADAKLAETVRDNLNSRKGSGDAGLEPAIAAMQQLLNSASPSSEGFECEATAVERAQLFARVIRATQKPERALGLALALCLGATHRAVESAATSGNSDTAVSPDIPNIPDIASPTVLSESQETRWGDARTLFETVGELRPDIARVLRSIKVVAHTAALAPQEFRAPLYAMLGLLWWLRGMQSVAQRFSTLAIEAAPQNALAQLACDVNEAPPKWCLEAIRNDSSPTASAPPVGGI